MFDFRYHAISLVAVLVALLLGLLLGVAIGDRNLVSSAERDLRASLRADVEKADKRADLLGARLAEREELEERLYPLLVGGQLDGQRVGAVFLGDVSQGMTDQIQDAVRTAGGQRLPLVTGIDGALPLTEIASRATGTRYEALGDPEPDPDLAHDFGVRIGVQLVKGGKLIERVRGTLTDTFNGSLTVLDAVVVARRADRAALKGAQATIRDRFEQGFVEGLRGADVPVVGVETSDTDPSQVNWYRDRGISSVDDLDDVAGRIALVFALAGADGQFGRKDGAQLLPDVVGGVRQP